MSTLASERAATLSVFLGNGIGIGAWAVAIPSIKARLLLGDAELGVALLAFAIGAIVAMQAAGRIAHRFGSGPSTAVAAAAFGMWLVAPAFASGFASLFTVLLVLGAANGATDVLMNAHASAIERAWGKPIMSSFHAAWSIGGLTGAALGGVIAAHGATDVAKLGIPAAAIIILFAASACAGLRGGRSERGDGAYGFVRVDRSLLGIGCIAFLCMLTEGAVADWSAVYLRTVAQANAAGAATGYAAFALAMAVCRLFGDQLVRRFGETATMRLGGVLAAAGFAVIIAVPDTVATSAGFVLVGVGLANVVPVLFSNAGRRGASPALGVAMAASAGYAGFLAGPPVIGFIAGVAGLRTAFLLLLVATAVVSAAGARALGQRSPSSFPARRPK
jgi:MFS family permease